MKINTFRFATVTALWLIPAVGLAQGTGCDQPSMESGTYETNIGGVARSYRLLVPENYDPATPTPLILAFHGWGGGTDAFLGAANVADQSSAQGFIVAAPVGLGEGGGDASYSSWSFPGSSTGIDGDGAKICDDANTGDYSYASCKVPGAEIAQNTCSWTHCQGDDAAFVTAFMDELSGTLCIDQNRIYGVGGSNGGMFLWTLAQNPDVAGRFAAIAPLIGLPHRGYTDGPAVDGGVPVLSITGMSDPTVPPGEWEDAGHTTTTDGDFYYYTGATAITRAFAEAASCDISQPAQAVAFDDGSDCRSYCSSGAGEVPAVLDCRRDMAHVYELEDTWPMILNFFDAHQKQ
ncbi:alpha/beta hydrolase family esterase [Tateyamaria pelophila]|uniref:alpha/beta hydrolase family esterase n=1 Tax=Tateyamaria pelophila TaxID=328415 RepID=UPI001CBD6FA7|nr:alpha/beta hydrolase-fold protein [Tateyamaria pelophila]